ncbi:MULTISPECIES: 4-hydroxy-tetrahydrodipicolinate synthase [Paenibacillus]|uniref:4-hydroxy-tetrahydrodipicolinate synthase n=1 Tax=Paenibacillus illinoisensis TaxID=59845 RepID=A0A2W0C7H2_9BACL|nr:MULTISPECIES: 4-hydroxy-tetrahydrodipicolinate synthase [Paenibacillus]PAD32418.1 4-hydroxy-tetrahydrodipicolinate synthase [Paenibacillus sp. 7523-1]PYY26339.1 4-hydroxy-tetrahydrodipicolinate synthase [Paenibacillus illinoisensis]
MLTEQQIQGIYVPVITPFTKDNQLDIPSFRNYITHMANSGIHGLVINGTTGESPTVSWDEVEQLVQVTKETLQSINKTIPIVVGTGTNDTASTVKRTQMAGELGADAVLVVTPYYNRPTEEGIFEHFRVTAEVGVPIIVYEIPARTGVRVSVDTMKRIMNLDGVIGLKDSTNGVELMSELVRSGSKPILCGDDAFFYDMLSEGAAGGMLASANINTEQFIEVYDRFKNGDKEGSREQFTRVAPFIDHLFAEPAPAMIKWLLVNQGIISCDQLRLPLMPASEQLKAKMDEYLVSSNAVS